MIKTDKPFSTNLHFIERFLYVTVLTSAAMPILPNFIRVGIIVLLLVGVLASLIIKQVEVRPDYKLLIIGSSLYMTYLISLFYTENIDVGLRKLETGSSLILLPIIFSLLPLNTIGILKRNFVKPLQIYIIAVSAALIISFCYFVGHYQWTLFQHYPTVIDRFLGPYNIHPIYLSMHCGIAILFSMYLITKREFSISKKVLYAINILLLTCFMLLLIKKGPIISLIIAAIFFVVYLKNKYLIIILGTVCSLFFAVILFHPTVNSKFSELLEIGAYKKDDLTSTNIRLIIYDCAKQNISDAGLLGFGVGDAKSVLLNCYEDKNEALVESQYNSHNQYLSIVLRSGIIGLLCFILFLTVILVDAHRNKGYILIAVTIFYLLVMFSENILERENGVIYFYLWTLLLYKVFHPTPIIADEHEH